MFFLLRGPIKNIEGLNPRIRFFDIPRELRNSIYELALVRKEPIDVLISLNSPTSFRLRGLLLVLLRVLRQIYNEAITVFYGLNTFRATLRVYCFKLNDFLSKSMLSHPTLLIQTNFKHLRLRFIRRVTVRLEFDYNPLL